VIIATAAGEVAPDTVDLHVAPMTPEEALKAFVVEPGFRVELVASEPVIADPVAAAYDENGRLYVCALVDYPELPATGIPPRGRIIVADDSDGDGRYERSTVLADGLAWPTGIACWKGGVFVLTRTELLYLKDTTGDGVADVRTVVVSGFRVDKAENLMNTLGWGLDNHLHAAKSSAGGTLRQVAQPDAPALDLQANFRIDPQSGRCSLTTRGGRFGWAFDDWGNHFGCDATTLLMYCPEAARYLAGKPAGAGPRGGRITKVAAIFPISEAEPWKVQRQQHWARFVDKEPGMHAGRYGGTELVPHGFTTGGAGVGIYRGSLWPAAYLGNAFSGEPPNNLVVRQKLVPEGTTFTADRPDPAAKREFLASRDRWFRPLGFANAPDGCLHVIDMYREVIEYYDAIPKVIRDRLRLNNGSDMGRIWRVIPEGATRPPTPRLGQATTAELIAALDHGDAWRRETAQRLLVERQDRAAVADLERMASAGRTIPGRLHVLWTLRGLDALTEPTVRTALADPHPVLREHGIRLAEVLLASSAALRMQVTTLSEDADPRVRLQATLSLAVKPVAAPKLQPTP